jgi:hypothetical protein
VLVARVVAVVLPAFDVVDVTAPVAGHVKGVGPGMV